MYLKKQNAAIRNFARAILSSSAFFAILFYNFRLILT